MIQIQLPNGAIKEIADASTVNDLAQEISSSLAKSAIAAKVNGQLVDTSHILHHNDLVQIITAKDEDVALEIIRHSTAHLLAYAAQDLFPGLQVTIGPVIENGFYYDFAYERGLTQEDLGAIEKRMREIAARNETVYREIWNKQRAIDFFKSKNEYYKVELIESIPAVEDLSVYHQGSFTDLCRGPHVPSLGFLKVFKLMKVAGAYWRGDSKREMLQRVYGTAWLKQSDQDEYLHRLEEAEKRDHRKLGKQLNLFHFQDEAPGLVFWHPKGWAIWQAIENYLRQVYIKSGYQEVRAPQILDRSLWERSGHWENYHDNMFTTDSENRNYALKPMNCPGHVQIYNSGLHSYRELPLRYGEFGQCHRNESSGALHGLMRVRGFTQDDGHIFCTEDQIQEEVANFCAQVQAVYQDFGFEKIAIKLALRPEKRVGADDLWDKAENSLHQALKINGYEYTELPGEGAFYGPKIEFHIQDAIGRSWQCGTIQVDFSMPIRLDAEYVDHDNQRKILGSMERFIGILIENHAGSLPFWLAPVQAVICTISEEQKNYANQLLARFKALGFRVELDERNEKINYKVREHTLQKIPYLLIIGQQEMQNNSVAIRQKNENRSLTVDELLAEMQSMQK
jgi:threonyl-tRNA synthetase